MTPMERLHQWDKYAQAALTSASQCGVVHTVDECAEAAAKLADAMLEEYEMRLEAARAA